MLQRRLAGEQSKVFGENKRGGGMKRPVRIYLRRDCGSCGRRVEAKINIWIQNGKHNIPSTQLREMQKRRSLFVLINEKYIRADDGNLSLDDASKKVAWKQHSESLLNIEFLWSQNLPHVDVLLVQHNS